MAWKRMTGLLVVVCASSLAQTSALTSADDPTTFTDTAQHYTLTAPPGWTQKPDMPRPYVAFLGPPEQGFQTNFTVYTEAAANKTLAQYVRVSRATLAKNKAIHLESDRRTILGGAPAVLLQSLVTAKGHPPSVVRQVLTVHDGRGYILTFTAPPATVKKYLPVFNKVLSSFHWSK